MKRSNTRDDFDTIHDETHIMEVIKSIQHNFQKYFEQISGITDSPLGKTQSKMFWKEQIADYKSDYLQESKIYRNFFDDENIEEYQEIDDPKVFKKDLRKECPIIRKTLNSKMEELQEWKQDFAYANAKEMLETFMNFIDYAREYSHDINESDYLQFSDIKDFQGLHEFSQDPDLGMQNVIGAGIKTTVLYHLDARFFNKSVRRNLYGLYFLTEQLHMRMPSATSEFTIIDDTKTYKEGRNSKRNYTIEHNYWYPYDLFMLYSKHVYDLLKNKLQQYEISLEPELRYVYVTMFLELVTNEHKEAVKTMMGGDQEI